MPQTFVKALKWCKGEGVLAKTSSTTPLEKQLEKRRAAFLMKQSDFICVYIYIHVCIFDWYSPKAMQASYRRLRYESNDAAEDSARKINGISLVRLERGP